MAAHAPLKNELTEDDKYHHLMSWLISCIADKQRNYKHAFEGAECWEFCGRVMKYPQIKVFFRVKVRVWTKTIPTKLALLKGTELR